MHLSKQSDAQWLVHDSLLVTAEWHGGRSAAFCDEGEPHDYSRLLDDALRLARGLQDLGLERGDRVVIHMENSWPCLVSIFGTLLAGGVFVVVNPQTKADKLAYILTDSEARFLLTQEHLAQTSKASVAAFPVLRAVICASVSRSAMVTGLSSALSSTATPRRK